MHSSDISPERKLCLPVSPYPVVPVKGQSALESLPTKVLGGVHQPHLCLELRSSGWSCAVRRRQALSIIGLNTAPSRVCAAKARSSGQGFSRVIPIFQALGRGALLFDEGFQPSKKHAPASIRGLVLPQNQATRDPSRAIRVHLSRKMQVQQSTLINVSYHSFDREAAGSRVGFAQLC